jgi:hypothetical protein
MKLNSALVARTLDQFEAQAVPDNHPVMPQLSSLFGDHTFFLDDQGLNIVEPTGATDSGTQTAQVIKLAEWKDTNRNSLVPHEPEATDVIVTLEGDGAEGPDVA